jgi:hypothetical protein
MLQIARLLHANQHKSELGRSEIGAFCANEAKLEKQG